MTDDYLRAFSGAVKHDSPNHYPSLKYRSGHRKPKGVATMTRDEAIEKAAQKDRPYKGELDCMAQGELLVNQLVALGMLKLDEPKSVNERAWEVLRGFTDDACVIDCLHRAGLKIVEK